MLSSLLAHGRCPRHGSSEQYHYPQTNPGPSLYWLEVVFENLQRLNPDVRVVLLTGCAESIADKMLKTGLRGYLQKPFSLPDLAQKIRDAIDTPVRAFSPLPSPT